MVCELLSASFMWCRWIDECPSQLNFSRWNGSGHAKFYFIIRKRCELDSTIYVCNYQFYYTLPRNNLSPSHIHFVTTQKHFFFSTLIFYRFAFVHNFKERKYMQGFAHIYYVVWWSFNSWHPGEKKKGIVNEPNK